MRLFHLLLAAAILTMCGVEAQARSRQILFVGNSFTFGAGSAAWKYRADTVRDLNGDGVGGVPALFKRFADQAGLDYQVSLETSGGKSLKWHWDNRLKLIDRRWDDVVLQDFSTLDRDDPGNDASLVDYAGRFADRLWSRNSNVRVHLMATWSRADQTYPATGFWAGKPISTMGCDITRGYVRAARSKAHIRGVIPVGYAFDRAFVDGTADPNPYDGISFGQVNLWTSDHYHASVYGYYLSALVTFGTVTGIDPTSLGPNELSASELGISEQQATALQNIASAQIRAGVANPRC